MNLIDKAFDWLGTKLNLVDRLGIILTAVAISIGAAITVWFILGILLYILNPSIVP